MGQLSQTCEKWLSEQWSDGKGSVQALVGDASSRQYFRVSLPDQSAVLMVAPKPEHKTAEFIALASALRPLGVHVPKVFAHDISQGFALLEDFGDTLLLSKLNAETMRDCYGQAIDNLAVLQNVPIVVPPFDEAHARLELSYFPDWYIQQLLDLRLTGAQQSLLHATNQLLVDNLLQQPQVFIHRDFHSRNLLVCPDGQLGIIDFQDALKGAITYDLVSLLKDCYIAWPEEAVAKLVRQFYEKISEGRKQPVCSFDTFLEWFDLTGLQRHLKVLGIFARLNIRDNKPQYLKDIPRILRYVLQVTGKYPALFDFHDFCMSDLVPQFQSYCEEHAIEHSIKVA